MKKKIETLLDMKRNMEKYEALKCSSKISLNLIRRFIV